MEGGKVIDARKHFKGRSGDPSVPPGPLEQLRTTTRTRREDQVVLARKMGEVAARLEPSAPRRAARQIMREAFGDKGSKRTGRLFLIGDDDAPATLESSGATWHTLIEAAARLLAMKSGLEGEKADSEASGQAVRIVRGTSFLPARPNSGPQQTVLFELLGQVSSEIAQQLRSRTRIMELWQILREAPFSVDLLEEGATIPPGPVPAAASLASGAGIYGPEYTGRAYFTFANNPRRWSIVWSRPRIFLGYIVKKKTAVTFVIPRDISDELSNGIPYHDHFDEVCDWISRFDSHSLSLKEISPYFENEPGQYKSYFDVFFDVFLEITPDKESYPSIEISIEAYDDISFRATPHYSYFPKYKHTDINRFDISSVSDISDDLKYWLYFVDYGKNIVVINRNDDRNISNDGIFGETSVNFSFDLRGEHVFPEEDRDRAHSMLIGGDAHFVPAFAVAEDVEVPARIASLASALLNNAVMKGDGRICEQVVEKAHRRAEAGITYYEAMLKSFEDRMTGRD